MWNQVTHLDMNSRTLQRSGDEAQARTNSRTLQATHPGRFVEYEVEETMHLTDDSVSEEESEGHKQPAIRPIPDEDGDREENITTAAELIEEMGISGLALMAKDSKDSFTLLSISAWSFTMQYMLLYNLWVYAKESYKEEEQSFSWEFLLFAAIYLHFLNCFTALPYGFTVLSALPGLLRQGTGEGSLTCFHVLINVPCFMIDAIITPIATMVVGSFFLCSSETVGDVLLNSCAVAFIANIDNWILGLNSKMKHLAGVDDKRQVHLPFYQNVAAFVEFFVIIVPLVPSAYALLILKLKTAVLGGDEAAMEA